MRLRFGNKNSEEDGEDPDRKYKDDDEEPNTGRGASRKGKGKGRGRGRGRARGSSKGSGKQNQETTPGTTTQEEPSNNAEVPQDKAEAPTDNPNAMEELAKEAAGRADNDVLTASIEKHQGGNGESEEPVATPTKSKRARRKRTAPKKRTTPKKQTAAKKRATPKRKSKASKPTAEDSQKAEENTSTDPAGKETDMQEEPNEAEGDDAPNEMTPRTKKKDSHEPCMHRPKIYISPTFCRDEFVTARFNCSTFNSLMVAASQEFNDIFGNPTKKTNICGSQGLQHCRDGEVAAPPSLHGEIAHN